MLFDDSWNHEVYNQCERDRVVLIVDIRRPMPQPFDGVNRLAQSIMKPLYGRHIIKRLASMTPPPSNASAAVALAECAGAQPAPVAHDRQDHRRHADQSGASPQYAS